MVGDVVWFDDPQVYCVERVMVVDRCVVLELRLVGFVVDGRVCVTLLVWVVVDRFGLVGD